MKLRRKHKTCIALLLLCFSLALKLHGQVTVSGVVSDPDGAFVPGVALSLQTPHGTDVAKSSTDSTGHFSFEPVVTGDYVVYVPAQDGFEVYRSPLHLGQIAPPVLRVRLRTASVADAMDVGVNNPDLSADAAANRDQVTADAHLMEKVPVFDQNYIATLTPFLDQTGLATSGVSIIVDGIEMKGTGVSASAIAEARINSDPYSAETNRPGKGRIEIITKPGTPQVHGTFNFTLRDSALDARNYFATTKPFEQKRIYEGSITGPVGGNHKSTFLVSGSRQEDNLQSIVHATDASGIVDQNVPTPVHDTEFAVRVAREISPRHRISLQYNVSDVVTRNLGVGGLVEASAGTNGEAREDDVIFNDRMIISPTLLNQLQLFFEKDYDPTRSVSPSQKIVVDGSFTSGGAQTDVFQTENNLKINDIVSWSHRHHYVKFGVNIPNLSRRAWEDHSNRLGTFNFDSILSFTTSQPYSFTRQAGPGRTTFWLNEIGSFVQDQIQLRPNVQISFGLRYDWQTYFKSAHDFAPRASVAYTTQDHKTVLRTGIGLFYDRSGAQPIADLKRYNGTILRSITLLNTAYPEPYPAGSDIAGFPTNLVWLQPGGRLPYITNFSAGIERSLSKDLTFAVTYRGTVGVALFRSRDVNAPSPPVYAVKPNPNFGVIRQIESKGRQTGNALDSTLSGKAGCWFSGMAQYTFSHTSNDTGGILWFPANQYSLRGEYGRSDFDQRHRLNLLATVNEDHWLNLGIALKLYSGLPYTETAGVDVFNTGLLNARPTGVSRNTLQTAGTAQLDIRWSKDASLPFKRGDVRTALSFAVDAFDVTNTANFTSYVGNIRSSFFEQPTTALPGRRIQLSARFKF